MTDEELIRLAMLVQTDIIARSIYAIAMGSGNKQISQRDSMNALAISIQETPVVPCKSIVELIRLRQALDLASPFTPTPH